MKKYRLKDIATVEISSVDKKTKEGETNVRLCNFTDVYYNWAITKDKHDNFMEATANNKEISRFLFKKGQVALTKDSETRYDIGIATYIADDFEDVVLGYHCALITPDESKVVGCYLNAFLHSNMSRKYFANSASGSGQRYTLSIQTIEEMPILLPEIEEQKQIGKLFSNIDRKIEINRALNHNLEVMAKQLYDYWFVQFDFPNAEGKPYKSSGGKMIWNDKLKREIPDGWFGENICRIADILSGGTPSKKEVAYWKNGTIPFFGPTDYSGDIFQISTEEQITEDGLTHCASSLFEKGVIIITARGSIGKLVVVGTPMAMNQSCYALQSKNGEFEYLYFLTRQLIESLKFKGSGSVFKSIIASDIENSWLCVGNNEVVSLFCDKVKAIFGNIKENTLEVAALTKQRDELLPLLMNSQVSVNYDLSND